MSRSDRPTLSELYAESLCPDCGKLTEYDPCAGDPHASEGFDRCDCEESAVSVAVEGIYSPLRDVREPIADSERFLPVKESA